LNIRLIYITTILQVLSFPIIAQDSSTYIPDTVKVFKGSIITIEDEKYVIDKDTVFIIPHGIKYKLRVSGETHSKNFFDTLEVYTSRHKWMNQLHNIVVVAPKKEPIYDTLQTSQSISPFIEYGGKIIRHISIKQLDPFGPTIFDTARTTRSTIENVGNKLHISTREKIISNYIIFSEGDRLNPSVISDNERIIRKLSFIEDARIFVVQIPESPEYVDILVLVKDAFSIGLGLEILDLDVGNIKLFENNLAGLGHELHANFSWDGSKDPWYGREYYYIINNLAGSFIDSKIRYAKIFDKETINVNFDRPFLTPGTKYAGAVLYEHTSKISNIDYFDTLTVPTRINYDLIDLWTGRAFSLNSIKRYSGSRTNFVIATHIQKRYYYKRPEVTEHTFYNYHNKILWLSSISLTQQQFFRSNLILNFGRTEDIPHGSMVSFTFGPEFGEFERRFYFGFSLSRGGLVLNQGYLYAKAELGGFTNSAKYPDQGVLHLQSNYFSNLFIVNRFKFRQFIYFDYMNGIQRFSDEYISIEDKTGIRGYDNDFAKGTQRAVANYEIVAFSPYYFYGFRFVFFGFMDFGLITFSEPLLSSNLHTGIGFGIRIKNERLTFETIQIRLGYYPSLPHYEFPLAIDISGERKFNPQDFYVSQPEVIGFK
jgi:hypothetical protein